MARRTQKKRKSARTTHPGDSTASTLVENTRSTASSTAVAELTPEARAARARRARRVLIAAAVFAAVWILLLIGLALFSANPVTLNPDQIRRATYVVTAKVSEDRPTTVIVEKEWKHGVDLGSIVLEELGETDVKSGGRYLIPLSLAPTGDYRVTLSRLPQSAPLIYHATPEAETQLNRILSSR